MTESKAGEWLVLNYPTKPQFLVHGVDLWPVFCKDEKGEWVALAPTRELAAQLLSDHRTAQAAAGLREALERIGEGRYKHGDPGFDVRAALAAYDDAVSGEELKP